MQNITKPNNHLGRLSDALVLAESWIYIETQVAESVNIEFTA